MPELILVLDDNESILLVYEQILKKEGYRVNVDYHCDGQADLELVKKVNPDLLIVDLLYPQRQTGWTLIQKIRTDSATVSLPILLCTAQGQLVQHLTPQLREKKVLVVAKPFTIESLLKAVRQLLSGKLLA